MIKGLDALHHPRIELANVDISAKGKHDIAYMPFYKTKQYSAIEKELVAIDSIRTKSVVLVVPESEYLNNEHISIQIYKKHFTKEQWDALKEVLGV